MTVSQKKDGDASTKKEVKSGTPKSCEVEVVSKKVFSNLDEEVERLKAELRREELLFRAKMEKKKLEFKESIDRENSEIDRLEAEMILENSEIDRQEAENILEKAELVRQETELIRENDELVRREAEIISENVELGREETQFQVEIERKKEEIVRKKEEIVSEKEKIVRKNSEMVRKKSEIGLRNAETVLRRAEVGCRNAEIVRRKAETMRRTTEFQVELDREEAEFRVSKLKKEKRIRELELERENLRKKRKAKRDLSQKEEKEDEESKADEFKNKEKEKKIVKSGGGEKTKKELEQETEQPKSEPEHEEEIDCSSDEKKAMILKMILSIRHFYKNLSENGDIHCEHVYPGQTPFILFDPSPYYLANIKKRVRSPAVYYPKGKSESDLEKVKQGEQIVVFQLRKCVYVLQDYESLLLVQKTNESRRKIIEKLKEFLLMVRNEKQLFIDRVHELEKEEDEFLKRKSMVEEEKIYSHHFIPTTPSIRDKYEKTLHGFKIILGKLIHVIGKKFDEELSLSIEREEEEEKKKRNQKTKKKKKEKSKTTDCREQSGIDAKFRIKTECKKLTLKYHGTYCRVVHCKCTPEETDQILKLKEAEEILKSEEKLEKDSKRRCRDCGKVGKDNHCVPQFPDLDRQDFRCRQCLSVYVGKICVEMQIVVSKTKQVCDTQFKFVEETHDLAMNCDDYANRNNVEKTREQEKWRYFPSEEEKKEWRENYKILPQDLGEGKFAESMYEDMMKKTNKKYLRGIMHTRLTLIMLETMSRTFSFSLFTPKSYRRIYKYLEFVSKNQEILEVLKKELKEESELVDLCRDVDGGDEKNKKSNKKKKKKGKKGKKGGRKKR